MARRSLSICVFLLGAASAAGLSACANLASFSAGPLPVPPGSPVALAVEDAQRNPGPLPTFAGVPKVPADAPNAEARAAAERESRAQAEALEREVANLPAVDRSRTEAFASDSRGAFAGNDAPPESTRTAAEAFARAARARATPPPAPR